MKFCKSYQEYMQRSQDRLPGVSFLQLKKLKKILKTCAVKYHGQRRECLASNEESSSGQLQISAEGNGAFIACHKCCPVCDQTFFPSLLAELEAVVCYFNSRAKQLLELRLASGFRKYLAWITSKGACTNQSLMIQEGKDLVTFASINAMAIRKILKKYDKVHYSKQGKEFRTRVQTMKMEILQSPFLVELIAFHINLMNSNNNVESSSGDCLLTFDGGKASLSCNFLDSFKLDIDMTCSICLETLFDPVSLKCGHIFCYSCACAAASVTIIEGLKGADDAAKCPLCRQIGVYGDTVRLVELSILLSESCKAYWEQRRQREREERLQQAKEYWEKQCRQVMGL